MRGILLLRSAHPDKTDWGYFFLNQKIVIVGLGLIGGSLSKAFRKYTDCSIAGIDSNPEVLKAALSCGAIDKIGNDEDIRTADLLYLCLYPQADIDFIAANLDLIGPNCVVTDACGIKSEISHTCRKWRRNTVLPLWAATRWPAGKKADLLQATRICSRAQATSLSPAAHRRRRLTF